MRGTTEGTRENAHSKKHHVLLLYEILRYCFIRLKHYEVRAPKFGTVAFIRVWQDFVGIPMARLLKIVHCQNTWMGVSDGIKWTRGRHNALKKWI